MVSAALRKARRAFDEGDLHSARAFAAADVCRIGREAGTEPVLVGGMCVDLWTGSTLASGRPEVRPELTQDVGMVSAGQFRPRDTAKLRVALEAAGYTKRDNVATENCRDWSPPGLPFLVQVLTGDPWPGDATAVVEIEGEEIRLWDPETTFWQYAENAWSQGFNREDWIRARALAAAQPDMDWDRLKRQAEDLGWLVDAARAQKPIEDLVTESRRRSR